MIICQHGLIISSRLRFERVAGPELKPNGVPAGKRYRNPRRPGQSAGGRPLRAPYASRPWQRERRQRHARGRGHAAPPACLGLRSHRPRTARQKPAATTRTSTKTGRAYPLRPDALSVSRSGSVLFSSLPPVLSCLLTHQEWIQDQERVVGRSSKSEL